MLNVKGGEYEKKGTGYWVFWTPFIYIFMFEIILLLVLLHWILVVA